jgi:hypothetical protein
MRAIERLTPSTQKGAPNPKEETRNVTTSTDLFPSGREVDFVD